MSLPDDLAQYEALRQMAIAEAAKVRCLNGRHASYGLPITSCLGEHLDYPVFSRKAEMDALRAKIMAQGGFPQGARRSR
jgi:hypothetical protein